jgi:1-acyl-sn-glycerol-3-phosphate acyltransferase
VYLDDRPGGYFESLYEYAGAHRPDLIYDVARLVLTPFCMVAFRFRCVGCANVPGSGPVILAPNHFSAMDHFFCGIYLRRRLRFMAKSQLFAGPLGWILRHGGAFPVRRGKRDEHSIQTALAILAGGEAIVIYPEGGRSRTSSIGERARPGVGRLALESGAPVVPVAICGSLGARNWKRTGLPRVTVRYGRPLVFASSDSGDRQQAQRVADRVLQEVRDLYAGVASPAPLS